MPRVGGLEELRKRCPPGRDRFLETAPRRRTGAARSGEGYPLRYGSPAGSCACGVAGCPRLWGVRRPPERSRAAGSGDSARGLLAGDHDESSGNRDIRPDPEDRATSGYRIRHICNRVDGATFNCAACRGGPRDGGREARDYTGDMTFKHVGATITYEFDGRSATARCIKRRGNEAVPAAGPMTLTISAARAVLVLSAPGRRSRARRVRI